MIEPPRLFELIDFIWDKHRSYRCLAGKFHFHGMGDEFIKSKMHKATFIMK